MSKNLYFKNNIQDFLNKTGKRPLDLANEIGISRQGISSIMMEKSNPSLKTAMDIARVFKVSVEDIFQLKDEE